MGSPRPLDQYIDFIFHKKLYNGVDFAKYNGVDGVDFAKYNFFSKHFLLINN